MDIVLNDGNQVIISAATSTGASSALDVRGRPNMTFQAVGSTTADAGAATIKIQVSNDGTNWIDLGTITLTLATTASSDGFASLAPWSYVRGNVTAISGTGASVTLILSV